MTYGTQRQDLAALIVEVSQQVNAAVDDSQAMLHPIAPISIVCIFMLSAVATPSEQVKVSAMIVPNNSSEISSIGSRTRLNGLAEIPNVESNSGLVLRRSRRATISEDLSVQNQRCMLLSQEINNPLGLNNGVAEIEKFIKVVRRRRQSDSLLVA